MLYSIHHPESELRNLRTRKNFLLAPGKQVSATAPFPPRCCRFALKSFWRNERTWATEWLNPVDKPVENLISMGRITTHTLIFMLQQKQPEISAEKTHQKSSVKFQVLSPSDGDQKWTLFILRAWVWSPYNQGNNGGVDSCRTKNTYHLDSDALASMYWLMHQRIHQSTLFFRVTWLPIYSHPVVSNPKCPSSVPSTSWILMEIPRPLVAMFPKRPTVWVNSQIPQMVSHEHMESLTFPRKIFRTSNWSNIQHPTSNLKPNQLTPTSWPQPTSKHPTNPTIQHPTNHYQHPIPTNPNQPKIHTSKHLPSHIQRHFQQQLHRSRFFEARHVATKNSASPAASCNGASDPLGAVKRPWEVAKWSMLETFQQLLRRGGHVISSCAPKKVFNVNHWFWLKRYC